ncbi:hypothetical protein CRE_24846 [Caenorhabditis remanei]|uniref:Uncharacterized protein n=1 Tax=Caenorhabditis remanei TaxID=31234 RepID=E3NKH2_CAERE|nr:hypothetical protein CRE_24846 [Caenorhabditis remanei]
MTGIAVELLTKTWRSLYWNNIGRQLKDKYLEPNISYRLLEEINGTKAQPAYKHVGYHFSTLDQLFTVLHKKPSTVAELLNSFDKNDVSFPMMQSFRILIGFRRCTFDGCTFDENLPPDVEITCKAKSSFVGFVADINVLTKMIRSTPASTNNNTERIVSTCEKLPETFICTAQKSNVENSEECSKVPTLRNIHRKVQKSLKKPEPRSMMPSKSKTKNKGFWGRKTLTCSFWTIHQESMWKRVSWNVLTMKQRRQGAGRKQNDCCWIRRQHANRHRLRHQLSQRKPSFE